MSSLIALKPRAVALLRAAILFAAKDDAREQLTAVCIDPDARRARLRFPLLCFRVVRRPTAEKLPDIYRW